MRVVNRSAAVIRPREPYVNWASSVGDDSKDLEAGIRQQISVYLVPPDPREEQESAPVSQWFAAVFEQELEAWCLDEKTWPQRRDLKMFLEWFEVTTESVVMDLEERPVEHEDW
jgi:hypothetical protein